MTANLLPGWLGQVVRPLVSDEEPRIEIAPTVGIRPQVRGVSTRPVARAVWEGRSVGSIQSETELTRYEVMLACWWEWRFFDAVNAPGWGHRRNWMGDFIAAATGEPWSCSLNQLPDPPTIAVTVHVWSKAKEASVLA